MQTLPEEDEVQRYGQTIRLGHVYLQRMTAHKGRRIAVEGLDKDAAEQIQRVLRGHGQHQPKPSDSTER
jgi:hypothetical protein